LRCTFPRTVSFARDGKTICWSPRDSSKELVPFQLPCGKCLQCRLDYARQWAVRCVHEASQHEHNIFLTLTYDDAHLTSDKLVYEDFQNFMKKLRKVQNDPIAYFVTGEYGEKNKRPHWHAILFNFAPKDGQVIGKTERGDEVRASATLSKIWSFGRAEFGSVTFESAGYCARYAAKKLVHGKDQDHCFHPISKKSSKHAIGKKFLEKHYTDIFNYGVLTLPDGQTCSIPRYYERWFKEHHPAEYFRYVTEVKPKKIEFASRTAEKENLDWCQSERDRLRVGPRPMSLSPNQRRKKILQIKFERMLQNFLKL